MELVPWKPYRELGALRQEMDDLFKSFRQDWLPAMDVSETGENFIIKAELPGMEKEDVEISVSGNLLNLKGEKRKEKEEKSEHHHQIERYSGVFQRSFRFPGSIQIDKVKATFDKGILTITLPKAEEAKTKQIKIEVH
jgi:HSP20 family protein